MATEFKLPELGEGVENADVARIYVAEGDQVEVGQSVLELETEKSVADLPCPLSGTVSKIHVSEGDTIEIGQTVFTIDEVAASTESSEKNTKSDDQRGDTAASEAQNENQIETSGNQFAETRDDQLDDRNNGAAKQPQRASGDSRVTMPSARPATSSGVKTSGRRLPPPAGPATRRLARKLNVDLEGFDPGKGGRIRQEDVVRAYMARGGGDVATTDPLPDFSRFGPVERAPLNKVAKTAARRLTASWRAIPHVTQHDVADITDLENARRQYDQHLGDPKKKITLTPIVMKCVASLLREHPKFNASLDLAQGELILKKHYHIGVAVDTDHGLLVPVIRDVDCKSIEQIAVEMNEIAIRARDRELGKEDFEGGTFTISNQGGIGGGHFTPIVNHPEVAILGIARARRELRLVDGAPAERLILPLSLSYDHRVINGADAARFISRLTKFLSDEFALLISM